MALIQASSQMDLWATALRAFLIPRGRRTRWWTRVSRARIFREPMAQETSSVGHVIRDLLDSEALWVMWSEIYRTQMRWAKPSPRSDCSATTHRISKRFNSIDDINWIVLDSTIELIFFDAALLGNNFNGFWRSSLMRPVFRGRLA